MHEDFDDTVLVPLRREPQGGGDIDEDTLVPARGGVAAADRAVSEPVKTAARRRSSAAAERRPPSLVEPVTTKQRRVPLTHKRLQETLRVPAAAQTPGILPGTAAPETPIPVPTVPAPAAAYGFRVGDRPAVALDVPALVGRKPTAPRIPGGVFPRLVRVPSPLNEVSSTHLELRQEGSSVIVTDLRSTNGTVVRMPGSRPVKLRQGESLVVRPGSLVDIGDGNVLEILPPPRLTIPGDSSGERGWS